MRGRRGEARAERPGSCRDDGYAGVHHGSRRHRHRLSLSEDMLVPAGPPSAGVAPLARGRPGRPSWGRAKTS